MEFYSFVNLHLRLYEIFYLYQLIGLISSKKQWTAAKKLVTVLKEVITVKMFFCRKSLRNFQRRLNFVND